MKWVHCRTCEDSSSHVLNTPQPRRQSTKLKAMTISIKTKVVTKFELGFRDDVCKIPGQKAMKWVHIAVHMKPHPHMC